MPRHSKLIPRWIHKRLSSGKRSIPHEQPVSAQESTLSLSSSSSVCSVPLDQRSADSDWLCGRCQAIDLGAIFCPPDLPVPPTRWWEGRKVGSLEPLLLDPACSLCQLFYALRCGWPQGRPDTHSLSGGTPEENCHLRLLNLHSISGGDVYRRQPPVPVVAVLPAQGWERIGSHKMSEIYDDGAFFLLQTNPSDASIAKTYNPLPGASSFDPITVNYASIHQWLKECDAKHTGACRHSKPNPIAVRCIDCLSPAHEIVRMKPGDDYFALSYVWGAPSRFPTSEAKSGRRGELVLPSTSIPAVITDAMTVVVALGKRYLWVDKYCIDQDNHDAKLQEIRTMDHIYRGAYATIVAASGPDASYGLAGVSRERTRERMTAQVSTGMTFVSGLSALRPALDKSTWTTRGWTYQEAVLSRRAIIFTPVQVYFVCTSMTASESINSVTEHVIANKISQRRHGGGILTASHFNNFFPYERHPERQVWSANRTLADHISTYTSRNLTVEDDILHAFRGLLARSPFCTYYGIPVFIAFNDDANPETPTEPMSLEDLDAGFAMGLTWVPAERNTTSDYYTALTRRAGFPSWSWTGWKGQVDYYNKHRGSARPVMQPDKHIDAAQIKVEAETASGDRIRLWDLRPKGWEENESKLIPELSPYIHIQTLIIGVRFNSFLRDHAMDIGVCVCHPCGVHPEYGPNERAMPNPLVWGSASLFAGLGENNLLERATAKTRWDCVLLLAGDRSFASENAWLSDDDSSDDDGKGSVYGAFSTTSTSLAIMVWTFLIVEWDGEAARRVGTLTVEADEERFYDIVRQVPNTRRWVRLG
ncbi:heterokaryon incompatibility protein-domain-containing protein [Podospora didyma]|uniref:Heterokaryon incompatibility protein-domain-containing protein n=1 Tax=Podospora didyma TaxID=330526 RepID=A0AAE0U013_9PEZI|nr:heterokaryon incompatibility protein-domain-containing protein [Podospora didyma]